ncbi:MAG: mannose-1-phosphate guanylyltransferase [Thermoanaerobaculales bacterium]|nr:mannose-1-phosphate guanylyltransferase [Thermoanaerobaculales bacterium]
MLHAVIMAGGSGTRFWPASRKDRPKQFLALAADKPLLRMTYERLAPLIPAQRIWVVTAVDTVGLTRDLLPELPPENVLGEPEGRDTAACVGFSAQVLRQHDPEAVCVILPADHVIGDEEGFRKSLLAGVRQVSDEGGLLTFGLRPTAPEIGFGYLHLGQVVREVDGFTIHHLDRFVEKPDEAMARTYLQDGGYLWNSGLFAWRAEDLLAEIKRQLPLLSEGLSKIGKALGTPEETAVLEETYPTLQRISVDFGVMEGAEKCWTIPVDYPWSDVGSWPALREVSLADEAGVISRGRVVNVDSADSVILSEGPVVAVVGVKGLVVVATKDAVLVVPADQAQKVKSVVAELERRGWHDVL